jgi:O-antigen/teichoic acid export membrane protein
MRARAAKPSGAGLRRGFAWNTLSQIVSAVTALALIPFIVGRIGLAAYGTLTLANSALTLSQYLDGGMLNTATRYSGLAVGAQDRRALTSTVTTISLIVFSLAAAIGAAVFILAPTIVGLFNIDRDLRSQAIYAARIVAIMLPLGLLQGILSGVLTASARFGGLAAASIAGRVWYICAVLTLVGHVDGLKTMMLILLVQQCGLLVLVAALSASSLKLSGLRLLPRPAIHELVVYSARVQAFALSGMVNLQADTFIVGAVLPIRYVGLFGIGSSIANQIRAVPTNVSGPIVARLTNTLGASGQTAAFDEYLRLQSIWMVWIVGFVSVTVGAVGFCISAWLGHRFTPAAIVAVALLAGGGFNLLTVPLSIYLQAIGRPDIEVRYGALSAGLNLLLTAALLWTGLYGITGATAVGVALGSLTMVPLARAGVGSDIPSFVSGAPWIAGLAGGLTSASLAFVIVEVLPIRGVLALVLTGVATVPGAYVFTAALLGQQHAREALRSAVRERSVSALLNAVSARATQV